MTRACSSVDRVPGYEPVGRRFESRQARQITRTMYGLFFCLNIRFRRYITRRNLFYFPIILRRRSENSGRASAKCGEKIPAYLTPPSFVSAATQLLPQVIASTPVHSETSAAAAVETGRTTSPRLCILPCPSTP